MGALLAILLAGGRESHPPPTIEELLKADFIAVGRFEIDRDGTPSFVAVELVKGSMETARASIAAPRFPVRKTAEGVLAYWGTGITLNLFADWAVPVPLSTEGLWFLGDGKNCRRIQVQPAGFADAYRLLLGGKEPPETFKLLQQLDHDLWRAALESLVATPDAALIEKLHAFASDRTDPVAMAALDALCRMGHADADRLRPIWSDSLYFALDWLRHEDPEQARREQLEAIAKETDPAMLAQRLRGLRRFPNRRQAEIALDHLGHDDSRVRDAVVSVVWNACWSLGIARKTDAGAQADFEAVCARAVPAFESRLNRESDENVRDRIRRFLDERDRLPIVEPLPPYSEEAEFERLMGVMTDAAGRELGEHFVNEAIEEVARRITSKNFNSDLEMDRAGYVRHPSMRAFIEGHARRITRGDRTFKATLKALGRQQSYDVLMQVVTPADVASLADGLAECEDSRAMETLGRLRESHGDDLIVLAALVRHGDAGAVEALIRRLPEEAPWVLPLLLPSDAPEVTEALKRHVEGTWPAITRDRHEFRAAHDLQNHLGDRRRASILGEVARRDPVWLATLSLGKMGSEILAARQYGFDVFRKLTGRTLGFEAEAFAVERRAPLAALRAWWTEHRGDGREEWVRSALAERGFDVDIHSVADLTRAIDADAFTQSLAVEQISQLTGKHFEAFHATSHSYRLEERISIRVNGWLRARGWIE